MAKKIILNFQVILVILGLCSQIGLFVFCVSNRLDTLMTISYAFGTLAFIAMILNVIFGRKYDPHLHYISIGLFSLVVLLNLILPFRDIAQRILLAMLFGLLSIHTCRQGKFMFNYAVAVLSVLVSIAFSIYSSILANPDALGAVNIKWLATMMMYISIFTPVIFTGLATLLYVVRNEE